MKTVKTLVSALTVLLLLGCLNPVSFNSSAPAEPGPDPASASDLSDWEPFDVTLTINGDGSVSMGGDRSARAVAGFGSSDIKASNTGARNYMQLIVAQGGEVTSFSDARQLNVGDPGAAFHVDVTSGKSYDFLLLMGHWEKEGAGTYKTDVPPTLLAAGLNTKMIESGDNTVTISMYPIVVQTEFTAPGVKVENPETNKVFSLIPGNWNAVWTVTKGAVSTDPLQILVDAQKKIAGQTGLDTLKLKAKSATGDPLLGLGSLDGNVYTVGVGDYGLQQVGTAGYANFKLEYVPFGVFDDTAWAGFDGVGKIDGVPKWIIRNGINDAVQDTQTAFGNPNSWGGTANGNGAVPWVIAVKTPGGGGSGGGGGGGSTLEVKVDSYDWTGAKPTVGFTTDGYDDGDAEAYYVVVGKDTGAPSGYAGYTQFPGTFAPGAHPGNEITLGGGQTGNTYDVYVVIYKDGAVSDPAKITITKGSKVTIIPTWGAEVEPPEMVQVAGGTFTMGHKMSGNNTDNPNEKPEHDVTLSGFWMGKYEVTQKEWEAVMGSNPSAAGHKGDNIPVEFVSWYDAVAYCNELSEIEGLTKAYVINGEEVTCNFSASGYRLPTEAEWEYAAKGGANKDTYRYSGGNTLDNVAWHMYNADAKPHPVGEKSPNSLGLYDMTGNAWEFCWDWIGDYESSSQENPKGADMGEKRVYRGGCVGIDLDYLELTYRGSVNPSNKSYVVGFRLARSL